MKSLLLCVMAALVTFTGLCILPVAAQPDERTFHVVESNISYLRSTSGESAYLVDRTVDEAGRTMLCVQFDRPSPDGVSLRPVERATPALQFLARALAHGDPVLTGDGRKDFYIIQYAAHSYANENMAHFLDRHGNPLVDPEGILSIVARLKEKADAYTQPEATVTIDAPAFEETRDGEYLSTAMIPEPSVPVTALDVAPEGEGVRVADAETMQDVTSIIPGDAIRLVLPIDAPSRHAGLRVRARATLDVEIAYIFGGNDAVQRLVGLETEPVELEASGKADLEFPEIRGAVRGLKVDEHDRPLAGAEFTLTTPDGTVVDRTLSDDDGAFGFADLHYGRYTVTETRPVEGYVALDEPMDILVDRPDQTIELGRLMNRLARGVVSVTKVDQSGAAVRGAVFELRDESGTVTEATSDASGRLHFPITAGHVYSLSETVVPSGYAGGFVVTGITVADDGVEYDYTAVNTRIPPPSATRPVTAINSGGVG